MIEAGLLALAATCVLHTSETQLEHTDLGWLERVKIEVRSRGHCHAVDVRLPPGVELGVVKGRVKFSDDTGRRLDDERWERLPRGLDGWGTVRVHVPELLKLDRVLLQFTREWTTDAPFRWRPGADGADWAELLYGRNALVSVVGDVGRNERKGEAWADRPSADVEVRVHRDDPRRPPPTLKATTAESGLAPLVAHERAAEMVLLPRGVDGAAPVSGDQALARRAADDRGFAATVVALARGSEGRVELGWWLPSERDADHVDVEDGAVAIWWSDRTKPVPLSHPASPPRSGLVWTPSGVVEVSDVRAPQQAGARVGRPTIERDLTLVVPPGDPHVALWPGGGSVARVVESVTMPPSDRATTWTVDLPTGHTVTSVVEDGDAETSLRYTREGALWVVGPSETPSTLALAYDAPDAPSCGRNAGPMGAADFSLTVKAPGGRIDRDEQSWWLESHRGKPVLPDRQRVVDGLDYRFRTFSIPEPGLPVSLRAHLAGWELVEAMRPALHERARSDDLPGHPLWPRRLLKARKSGVVTSVEAALILRGYALQAKIPATWVLVRPADQGDISGVCPEGYPEALVRVWWQDEERWIDPSCTVCAPFELRPHLQGASALGFDIERTPGPFPGSWTVEVTDEGATWSLDGSAATELRSWLSEVHEDVRSATLAGRIAGAGAVLQRHAGLSEPGAAAQLTAWPAQGKATHTEDPLAVDSWNTWIGPRRLIRSGAPRAAVQLDNEHLTYGRTHQDGRTTEILVLKQRRLGASDLTQLWAVRAPVAEHARPVAGVVPGAGSTLR